MDFFTKYLNSAIALLILLIGILGCSGEPSFYTKNPEVNFHLLTPAPHGWEQRQAEGADISFSKKRTESTFVFNSSCRKSEFSSLQTLTNSLLNGIENLTYISKKNILIENRAGIETKVKGQIDGITTFLAISTLQKNFCIYDYILISTSQNYFEADYKDFQNFIERIKLP